MTKNAHTSKFRGGKYLQPNHPWLTRTVGLSPSCKATKPCCGLIMQTLVETLSLCPIKQSHPFELTPALWKQFWRFQTQCPKVLNYIIKTLLNLRARKNANWFLGFLESSYLLSLAFSLNLRALLEAVTGTEMTAFVTWPLFILENWF